jgi:hypothetical protein
VTYEEIKTEVRRRINEVSSTWWTDAEIEDAIHEAEDEFADGTEWCERFQSIDILEDRPYYDLRTVVRRNFLVAGPTFNDTTNRWLIPISHRDLSLSDRRWEQRIAEPAYVQIRGLWYLGLFPVQSGDTGSVKQYYRGLPDHMSEDEDEPGFHITYHQALIEYAVADLLSQDNETDLTLMTWKKYLEYEEGARLYYLGRIQVPALHGNVEG